MAGGFNVQPFLSVAAVIGLLLLAVWALRHNKFQWSAARRRSSITVETATSLGERRSLAIVKVENRRLLVGLTPGAVSLIVELAGDPPAAPSSGPGLVTTEGR